MYEVRVAVPGVSDVSRRGLFRIAAAGSAVVGVAALGSRARAHADPAILGTVVDYAGGVPTPLSIIADGHKGAVRYVSDRRPGAEWMVGKPMTADEAESLKAVGAEVVSCYQFGKGATADWHAGLEGGKKHAARGLELHKAAGGPDDRPIYASIDDNPTPIEFATMIAPYLIGWQSVIGAENVGVYANSPTIDLANAAGLGTFFWQHNWGTPKGYVNPAAHLHQVRIDKDTIDGVGVDINNILKPDYGQWSLA